MSLVTVLREAATAFQATRYATSAHAGLRAVAAVLAMMAKARTTWLAVGQGTSWRTATASSTCCERPPMAASCQRATGIVPGPEG